MGNQLPAPVLAPVGCAVSTAAAALRAVGDLKDRRLLITGAGLVGLSVAALASQRATRQIVLVDRDARRLQMATEFGATHTINSQGIHEEQLAAEITADVVIECTGAAAIAQLVLSAADVTGTIALVGAVAPTQPIALYPEPWYASIFVFWAFTTTPRWTCKRRCNSSRGTMNRFRSRN